MSPAPQDIDDAAGNSRLDTHLVRESIVWCEEARKVIAAEFWGFDGFLHRHLEHRTVQKELQLPLVLLVTSHAPEHHPWLFLERGERRADCRAGALVRRNPIWMMFWSKIKGHQARSEGKSQVSDNL